MKMRFDVMREPFFSTRFELRVFVTGFECEAASVARADPVLLPAVVNPVTLTHITQDQEATVHSPMMTLRAEDAQGLMDALYEAGVRPSNGAGSVGQLAATERHLADMKTIAFSALKIGVGAGARAGKSGQEDL